jgi:hypothetical protein
LGVVEGGHYNSKELLRRADVTLNALHVTDCLTGRQSHVVCLLPCFYCLFSMNSVAGTPPSPPPSQDLLQYSSPTLSPDFEDFHHPHFYYPEKRLCDDEAIILKVHALFLILLA